MNIRSAVAMTALAIALTTAGASQAAILTSDFTVDGASGGLNAASPYGEVTVDDAGGKLAFNVVLFDGLVFRDSPDSNHYTFTFTLDLGTAGVGSIVDNGVGTFTSVAGPVNQSPFGSFQYAVDCTSGCSKGYKATSATQLSFVVSAPAALTINDITKNGSGYFFASDVANTAGATGNIGATGLKAGVPEPATWAMMILGLGGVGATLRRRRAALAFA
jgi:hypothetical protein